MLQSTVLMQKSLQVYLGFELYLKTQNHLKTSDFQNL